MKGQAIFVHEKPDVCQVELSFVARAANLLEEIKAASNGSFGGVCDQLDRASLSALLNTAEGNGKRQTRQRARFFDDARGSAVECSACLEALVAKRLTNAERIADGKAMLLRVVGMLTKLVDRFDGATNHLHKDAQTYDNHS